MRIIEYNIPETVKKSLEQDILTVENILRRKEKNALKKICGYFHCLMKMFPGNCRLTK